MKSLDFGRRTLGVCVAAAMLAGCGSQALTVLPDGANDVGHPPFAPSNVPLQGQSAVLPGAFRRNAGNDRRQRRERSDRRLRWLLPILRRQWWYREGHDTGYARRDLSDLRRR